METIRIPYKTWDKIPDGERPIETYIIITGYKDGNGYAYSPDGYGCHYYDTLAQMKREF